MPYNYLVDRKTQGTIAALDLTNAVVIFDEAHNIEGTCGEASSTDIAGTDLARCLGEIDTCARLLHSGQVYAGSLSEALLAEARNHIIQIKSTLDRLAMDSEQRLLQRGEYIVSFFAAAGINEANVSHFVASMEEMARFYLEGEFSLRSRNVSSSLQTLASSMRTIFRCANSSPMADAEGGARESALVSTITQDHDRRFFRVFAEVTSGRAAAGPRPPALLGTAKSAMPLAQRTISYWCFNPGIALRELMNRGIHCMLLTSGTLSPLGSFTAELQLYVPRTA